jgi:hypothetical protein
MCHTSIPEQQQRLLLMEKSSLICVFPYAEETIGGLYTAEGALHSNLQNPAGSPFEKTAAKKGIYAVRVVELPSAPTWDRQLSDPPKDEWNLCPVPVAVCAALYMLEKGLRIIPDHHMGSCAEGAGSGHRAAFYIARVRPGTVDESLELRVATTASAVNVGAIVRIECKLLT